MLAGQPTHLSAQVSLTDGFDAGNTFGASPAGWTVSKPAGTDIRVLDQTVRAPVSSPYCVEFSDDSSSTAPEMWQNFAVTKSGRCQFSVFIPATNRAPFQVQLRTTNGVFLLALRLGEDGRMASNATPGGNGPFTNSPVSWMPGQWQTVRVDWRQDNTFVAHLESNQFAGGVAFATNATPGQILFRLATSSQTGRVAYLDDVIVTSLTDRRVVAYYPSWIKSAYPYTKVAYEQMTHIAHAFITPETNGTLNVPASFLYPELVQEAHMRGVKVIISVGGGSGSANFPAMANVPAARAIFVQALTSFCASNNYDGADIDWERPSNVTDRTNFTLLLQQLRAAFDAANPAWTLSSAIGATSWSGQWLDVDQIKNYLDWFGVMTYDFHGPWTSHAGHNSPLYGSASDSEGASFGAHGSMQYYLSRNVPKEQILMGIPFYNRQFNASQLYGPSTGGDGFQYSDVQQKLSNGWTRVWDSTSLVPYLLNSGNTQLVTYDDQSSLKFKCDYVAWHGLGGIIIWALGQDLYLGQTPLLNVVGSNLLGTPNPVVTSLPDTDGDSQNDGDEMLAGTNPNNSTSVFQTVSAGATTSNGFKVEWTSVPGARYQVQCRDELTNGWSSLSSQIATVGTLTNYVDGTAVGLTRRFYRVVLVP